MIAGWSKHKSHRVRWPWATILYVNDFENCIKPFALFLHDLSSNHNFFFNLSVFHTTITQKAQLAKYLTQAEGLKGNPLLACVLPQSLCGNTQKYETLHSIISRKSSVKSSNRLVSCLLIRHNRRGCCGVHVQQACVNVKWLSCQSYNWETF